MNIGRKCGEKNSENYREEKERKEGRKEGRKERKRKNKITKTKHPKYQIYGQSSFCLGILLLNFFLCNFLGRLEFIPLR